ncbi:MAG: Asp23/Gls24 family envelope stress response protein [Synergistaceae bacterium]|nr:Asp23/Gls24 family envelope stress response protein [Synergistaceae bacterium]
MDQNHVDEKTAVHETNDRSKGGQFEGNIHISEDVIVELAKKTILGIPNIQPANMGIASKFGIGRKAGDGIRVSVEEGKIPAMTVDAYILVKYGQRIPDLAWDVQEKIKANLERYTGYTVSAVNINVQGIYLEEPQVLAEPPKEDEKDEKIAKSECCCEKTGASAPEEPAEE